MSLVSIGAGDGWSICCEKKIRGGVCCCQRFKNFLVDINY